MSLLDFIKQKNSHKKIAGNAIGANIAPSSATVKILGVGNQVDSNVSNVFVNGNNNSIGPGCTNINVSGDNNVVPGGATDISIINSSNVTITGSNQSYLNDVDITTGILPAVWERSGDDIVTVNTGVVDPNVYPDTTSVSSLGTSTNKWKDLFIGDLVGTINIGSNNLFCITDSSLSIGNYTESTGEGSIAICPGLFILNPGGQQAKATNFGSIAIGPGTSSGVSSVSIGYSPLANADYTIAIGDQCDATAIGATAIGRGATASDNNSISIGTSNNAVGVDSISIGNSSSTATDNGISIGRGASTTTDSSIAIGNTAQATTGNGAIAIGNSAQATEATTISIGSTSLASAVDSIAIGNAAQATAAGSVSIGPGNVASNDYAFATGSATASSGFASFAEGAGTVASGDRSHAEGQNSIASGNNSHAGGSAAESTRNAEWSRSSLASRIAQYGIIDLYTATTNATPTELSIAGGSGYFTIESNSAYRIYLTIICQNTSTFDTKEFSHLAEGNVLIKNVGGTTSLVGTSVMTSTNGDASLATASVAVTADNTNDRLAVTVTGIAATNIKWYCKCEYIRIY